MNGHKWMYLAVMPVLLSIILSFYKIEPIQGKEIISPTSEPNASHLVVSVRDGDIWVLYPKKGISWQLTFDGLNFDPKISPDGREVAYLSIPQEYIGSAPTPYDIWVADIETGMKWKITSEPAIRSSVAWSPDGEWLAYTEGTSLVLSKSDGTIKRTLANNVARDGINLPLPVWSSDGQSIACPVMVNGHRELWFFNVEGQRVDNTDNEIEQSTPQPYHEALLPNLFAVDLSVPYRYQGESDSGPCKYDNCGPTTVAIAIQYAKNEWVSISDIRRYISGSKCGSVNRSQLRNALNHWGVRNRLINGMSAVRDAINRGHIVIVPVVMGYIPEGSDYMKSYTSPSNHYNRYDKYVGGHFVVAKGISQDGKWVIVHDPNVFHTRGHYWYSGNIPKGKSRYYSYSAFAAAFANNSNIAIEILDVADLVAPSTSHFLRGVSGGHGWYRSPVTVTVTATDNPGGSGVKLIQYRLNNGNWQSVNGSSASFTVFNDGSYTLHYRAQDNAGNWEATHQTWFGIDTVSPALAMQIASGDTAHQSTVMLDISATDAGSGVAEMRVSNNAIFWSDWQPYASRILWTLPALDQHTLNVYVQVRDHVGNESPIVSDMVTLDLYALAPHSTNYRLCNDVLNSGGTIGLVSANYILNSSFGQPLVEHGDILGLSGCRPIARPTREPPSRILSVAAAGGNRLTATGYRLIGSFGQPLATGALAHIGGNYRLSSGFYAYWPSVGNIPTQPWRGQVALQGHGPAGGSRWAQYPLTLRVFAAGASTPLRTESLTLDANGVFTASVLSGGVYDLEVEGPHSLCNRRERVQFPFSGVVDMGLLREGDANDDEKVDILDFSLLASVFGSRSGDGRYRENVDFNDDGKVDILDFSLLATNFGMRGCVQVNENRAPRTSSLAERPMRVWLEMEPIAGTDGNEVAVHVKMDTRGQPVDGVRFVLRYGEGYEPVGEVSLGQAFPVLLGEKAGEHDIEVVAGRALGEVAPRGVLEVARVVLRGTGETRDEMKLDNVEVAYGGRMVPVQVMRGQGYLPLIAK